MTPAVQGFCSIREFAPWSERALSTDPWSLPRMELEGSDHTSQPVFREVIQGL